MTVYNMMRIFFLFLYHPFVKATPYVGDVLYVGCYDIFDIKFARFETVSVRECLQSCLERTYYFGAMTFEAKGPYCLCGNLDADAKTLRSEKCLVPCQVNGLPCGDKDRYAVYTTIPSYLGCFRDVKEPRDLDKEFIYKLGMTNQHCFDSCNNKGKFAGTQYHTECYCGDSYGKYGPLHEEDCMLLCHGNRMETCGGHFANSVYSISHIPALDLLYSDVFHCSEGHDAFGVCKSHACEPGWKGRKCNRRNCEVDNGKCGKNICQEFQIGNFFVSECLCDEIFDASKSIYHDCEEIKDSR